MEVAREATEAAATGPTSAGTTTASETASEAGSSASASAQHPTPEAEDARKILQLLSDIGASQMLSEEFHPWFWEPNPSKLMTV